MGARDQDVRELGTRMCDSWGLGGNGTGAQGGNGVQGVGDHYPVMPVISSYKKVVQSLAKIIMNEIFVNSNK